MGSRLGGTVWPLVTQAIVSAASWRVASVAVGSAALVFGALPAALFLRRRPEDLGLLPDGVSPEEVTETKAQASGGAQRRDVSLTVRQVVRMRSFYLTTASFSLLFFASSSTNLHLIPYLQTKASPAR